MFPLSATATLSEWRRSTSSKTAASVRSGRIAAANRRSSDMTVGVRIAFV